MNDAPLLQEELECMKPIVEWICSISMETSQQQQQTCNPSLQALFINIEDGEDRQLPTELQSSSSDTSSDRSSSSEDVRSPTLANILKRWRDTCSRQHDDDNTTTTSSTSFSNLSSGHRRILQHLYHTPGWGARPTRD